MVAVDRSARKSSLITLYIHMVLVSAIWTEMGSHSLLLFIQQIFLSIFYVPGTVLGDGVTVR